jgi:hypothetical protein
MPKPLIVFWLYNVADVHPTKKSPAVVIRAASAALVVNVITPPDEATVTLEVPLEMLELEPETADQVPSPLQ